MPESIQGLANRKLTDNVEESIISINKKEEIILINGNLLNLYKIDKKKEDITGKKIWEFFPQDKFFKLLMDFNKKRELTPLETVITYPDDRVFIMKLLPILNSEEKFSATLCILRDMTSLKKMDESFEQLLVQISHELKMPLTSIKGFVEILLEGAMQDKNTTTHFLSIINEETNRLIRLVVNLLELIPSKPQAEKRFLTEDSVKKSVLKVFQMFEKQSKDRNIGITLNVPETIPSFKCGEDAFIQILTNLLDNAVKFTAIKGKGNVSVDLNGRKNTVELSVKDDGVGIAHEEFSNIFKKFYRIKRSGYEFIAGAGLGLSIVKKLVSINDAKIKVESILNEGSKFTVIFIITGENQDEKG